MRNKNCSYIGGEDPDNRFLSSHKRKTEEEKERGILQPSIHQKKDKLELCIISLILYLKSNRKWTSEKVKRYRYNLGKINNLVCK